MIDVYLDNRVRIQRSDLSADVLRDLREAFEHKNPQFGKLRAMGVPTWNEPATIRTWSEGPEWISFPGGGYGRVQRVLGRNHVDHRKIDQRAIGNFNRKPPRSNVLLWEHQQRLVDAGAAWERCILRAPTGSGKTTVGIALSVRIGLRTLVIVSTRALLDQWVERAQRELGLHRSEVGVVRAGGGTVGSFITIGVQRTVAKLVEDHDFATQFGLVIADEVQLFAAGSFVDAVDPFPARYRIGISADHRRTDRKEFLLLDLFGDVACEVTRKEVEDAGHTVMVEVRIVPSEFESAVKSVHDEDEDTDDLKPVLDRKAPSFETLGADQAAILDGMIADDARNKLIAWCAAQEVQAGGQVLVMAHRREHCREIDRVFATMGIATGFLIGGDDYRKEFERTRAGLTEGSIRVGVGTYQAIGVGIDLPKVAAVVCATPIASNRLLMNQVRGRACRAAKGKTGARIYYVWDPEVFGLKHARNVARVGAGHALVWDGGVWQEAKSYIRAASRKTEDGST